MFLVFEGLDGSGKTTQSRMLAKHLNALLTSEPYDQRVKERLPLLSVERQGIILALDRRRHVSEVLLPAKLAGKNIVCDRYAMSMTAYQCYGAGWSLFACSLANEWACQGMHPDLTILLDVPLSVAKARVNDRWDDAFMQRVQYGYYALAEEPNVKLIDGTGSADSVHHRVLECLQDLRH